MSKRFLPVWLCAAFVVLPGTVRGQEQGRPPRFVASMALGATAPSGDVPDAFGTGFTIELAAGYYLYRALRLDAAFADATSGSTTGYSIDTTGGTRTVDIDGETFLRVGPSLVLLVTDRLRLTVGGGGAWGIYREHAARSNEVIIGFEPQSRSGTGRFGTVSAERMMTSRGGVGLSVTYYDIQTDGDSLHGLFAGPTRDKWIAVGIGARVAF